MYIFLSEDNTVIRKRDKLSHLYNKSSRRRNRIELAEGGSCFLDEVGKLKLELQTNLLEKRWKVRLFNRLCNRLGGNRKKAAEQLGIGLPGSEWEVHLFEQLLTLVRLIILLRT